VRTFKLFDTLHTILVLRCNKLRVRSGRSSTCEADTMGRIGAIHLLTAGSNWYFPPETHATDRQRTFCPLRVPQGYESNPYFEKLNYNSRS
jgi:hypothetical protein